VAAQQKPDYDQRLLEVGDEALWIWSHALIAGTLGGGGIG